MAAVIVFPAIDMKGGKVVRLYRGDLAQATTYGDDPRAQALAFAAAGAEWLHLVDLDGAVAGRQVNGAAVESILAAVKIPVQLGGGIRDEAAIERWLARGLARVILGTVALRDPDLVRRAARRFPGRIVVGIDARDGMVAVEGWEQTSRTPARELARQFHDAGVAAIVYTDIGRDGTLAGVNVESTVALARAARVPMIASGGVASLDDLTRLKSHEGDGIVGAIVGRALYDGRVALAEAISAAR